MPQYEINFADGSTATVEAPEDASERQVLDAYYGGAEDSGLSELVRSRAIRESGILGQFGRGLGAGALNIAELATLGVLSPLDEELEAPAREAVSGFFEGLQPDLLAREGEGSTAQRIAGGLGQAFGSTIPIFAAAGIGGLPAAAAVGAAAGAGEASERARDFGLSGEKAGFRALAGAGVGLTEMVPIARLFRAVDKIAGNLPRGWVERTREALITGGEEAAQEVVAGAMQNAIESGYNPEQDILETGLVEEGGYGFAVGATLEGLVQLAAGRRARSLPTTPPGETTPEGTPGTDLVPAPLLLEPPPGTQGELFSAEEMGLRAVEPEQEVLQLEDLRPDDRQQDMFARIEDQRMLPDEQAEQEAQAAARERLGEEQGDLFPLELEQTRRRLGVRPTTPEAEVDFEDLDTLDQEGAAPQQLSIIDEIELDVLREQEEQAAQAAEEAAAAARARAERTRRESDLETLDARVADAERARSRARRLQILQDVVENTPTRQLDTLTKAFRRALEAAGITRSAPLPQERRLMIRAIDVQRAQPEPLPNIEETPESADNAALEAAVARRRDRPVEPVVVPEEVTPEPPPAVAPEPEPVVEEAPAEAVVEEPTPQAVEPEPVVEEAPPQEEVLKQNKRSGYTLRRDAYGPGRHMIQFYDNASKKDQSVAWLLDETGTSRVEQDSSGDKSSVPPAVLKKAREAVGFPEPVTPVVTPDTAEETQQEVEDTPQAAEPAPRELTEEELAIPETAPENVRRVDMEEQFARARPPQPRTEEVAETPTPTRSAAEDQARLRTKRGFDTLRASLVQGEPYADLESTARGPDPLTRGDYNVLGDLLSRPGADTKERQAARRYFTRYPSPVDAIKAMTFEVVNGVKNFTRGTEKASKALGSLAYVPNTTSDFVNAFFKETGGVHAQAALDWAQKNLSPEVQAYIANETARMQRDAHSFQNRVAQDLIAKDRKKAEKLDEQRAKEEEWLQKQLEPDPDPYTVKDYLALLSERGSARELASAMHPAVEAAMEKYGPQVALRMMANTITNPTMQRIVRRVADALEGTGVKVQLVTEGQLREMLKMPDTDTRTPMGSYGRERRTIYLNADVALNNHVLLHEAVHAVTLDFMRNNPQAGAVKSINTLFNTVAPILSSHYGSKNVVEFVSEALSNPEFRSELARLNLDGTTRTAWDKLVDAIKRILAKVGLPFTPKGDTLSKSEEFIERIIAGDPAVRDPGDIWMQSMEGNGADLTSDYYALISPATDQAVDHLRKFNEVGALPRAARRAVRFVQDLNLMARMAGEKFPAYQQLEDVIRRQAQYAQDLLSFGQESSRAIGKWGKQAQKDMVTVDGRTTDRLSLLSDTVNFSTRMGVDMAKGRDFYQKAYDAALAQEQGRAPRKGSQVQAIDARQKAEQDLTAYDTMAPWWNALGEDGHAEYKRAFNVFKRYNTELMQILEERFEQVPESVRTSAMFQELKTKLESGGIDPYFPLAREGTYWLSYTANDPITGQVDTFVTGFTDPKSRREAIENLTARAEEIGLQGEPQAFQQLQVANFKSAPPESFVGSVQKTLQEAGVPESVRDSILELYVNTLPERSFAKGLLHREGRRGDINDLTPLTETLPRHNITKVIDDKTRQFAKQFSIFKFAKDFNAVEKAGNEFAAAEANQGDEQVQEYKDDFDRRLGFARNPDISPLSRTVTSSLYLFTMGFSPATALLQFSTVPLVSYPMLGGQFGFKDAAAQIARSTSLLKSSGNKRFVERAGTDQDVERVQGTFRFTRSLGNYDFDGEKPDVMSDGEFQRMKVLVEELGKYNELGHTVNADMLDLEFTKNDMWGRTQQLAGFMNHTSELAARHVSAHSYYELALRDNPNPTDADMREAAKQAIEFVSKTNSSNLSGGVAPMSQDSFLRTFAMFKRWPVSMLQLQLEVINDAFRGRSPEERKMARKQLAGMYGTAGLMAGATGVPLYGVLQMVFDLFRDDDEEDFDTLVRTYMGEGFAKGIINYGLGVDVSTRTAMTNLVFREPLISQDNIVWDGLVMFGGPVVGVPLNIGRAMELFGQGNAERAIETMLPIQAKNILRTGRFALEGARTLNGDPIVGEISPFHVAGQLFGFAPAEYIRQLEQNAALSGFDRAVTEKKGRLLQRLNIARRDGDFDTMQDVMEDMQEFNEEHPQAAIFDAIERSRKAYSRTAMRRHHGLVYSQQNMQRLKALEDMWGPATIWSD